jgi:hypothetical protein
MFSALCIHTCLRLQVALLMLRKFVVWSRLLWAGSVEMSSKASLLQTSIGACVACSGSPAVLVPKQYASQLQLISDVCGRAHSSCRISSAKSTSHASRGCLMILILHRMCSRYILTMSSTWDRHWQTVSAPLFIYAQRALAKRVYNLVQNPMVFCATLPKFYALIKSLALAERLH